MSKTLLVTERSTEPIRSLRRSGHLGTMKVQFRDPFVEICFSATPGEAVALGHFSPPRSAVLARGSTRRCQQGSAIQ